MISNSRRSGYRVVIPAGIDPPSGVNWAKLCCLLQYVLMLTCLTDERRYRGHWINVSSPRWRSLLGSYNYRRIIDMGAEKKLIDVNERYSDGTTSPAHSKSVRLTKRFRNGKAQIVTITNQAAIDRLEKTWEPDAANLGQTGLWWFGKLADFRLSPASITDPLLAEPWTQLVLAKWLDGRLVANRCDFRRLHTLLTQLPKPARQYLSTTNREPLAIVDVSACQPLIIGILAATRPTNPTRPRSKPSLLPYVARFRASADIKKWTRLCESSGIYRYLWQAIREYDGSTLATIPNRYGRRIPIDMRDIKLPAFKRSSLIPLFDRLDQMEANPVFKIIVRDFPTIAAFIRQAKSKRYRIAKRTISHQVIACMAQRFEAETIVDDVGGYLMQHHPDEPVATIHDAILCRQSFAQTAHEIVRTKFNQFGVNPNVKIDYLNPSAEA